MSSEKYQQGRQDAESGEFNPFFYDLYYDYRLGYDEMSGRAWRHNVRRQLPRLLLFLVVLIAAAGGLVVWLQRVADTPPPIAAAVPTATATSGPTRTRVAPSPTRASTPVASPFRKGRRAVVATGGSSLKMRVEPSTEAKELMKLHDGTEVEIIDGPIPGDNHTWWKIKIGESEGWAAEEYLELITRDD
jgi:hypothetical protein